MHIFVICVKIIQHRNVTCNNINISMKVGIKYDPGMILSNVIVIHVMITA